MSDSKLAPSAPATPGVPDNGAALPDPLTVAGVDAAAEETPDPALDPEIAALLNFTPVPRRIVVEGGWNGERQRDFIVRLALQGSPNKACEEVGMNRTGATKLYRSPDGASFRAAWDAAIVLARRRRAERSRAEPVSPGTMPPSIDHRRKLWPAGRSGHGANRGPLPGQVLNEFGEWEDEESRNRRADEARDNVSRKLLYARRLFLQEISDCPGKRAAFEILTELPIDWARAEQLYPQDDEPWREPSMRKPDMLLTAEAGWLGDVAHGPDKKKQLRQAIDRYHEEMSLDPIDWRGDAD